MTLQRSALSISLILALATAAGCPDDEKKKNDRVRILVTTDEHSHLLAVGPERDEWPLATTAGTGALQGGVARRATIFEQQRADGVPTVTLSNGDFSQGSLSGVAFTVANFDVMLMRQLGYDAIALGNHEFDLGPGGFVLSVAAAKKTGGAVPFVLTNARFSAASAVDDTLEAIYGGVGSGKDVVSGLVVNKEGIKVGVVSAMSPSAAYDVQYAAAPVTFSTANLGQAYGAYVGAASASIAAILQPVIDELRSAQGADVVVLLFHGGLASTGTNGDVNYVVPFLTGVDVVVGGHTHGVPAGTEYVADADARQVPVVQPAAYGNEVARVEFKVGSGRPTFRADRTAFIAVDDTVLPTSNQEVRAGLSTALGAIEEAVLPDTLFAVTGLELTDNPVAVGDLYFYPLGHTAFDVTGAVLPRETNALNLSTDAMLAVAQGLGYPATVALQNAGSIRGDLLAGETGTLAFADVFRMASLGADPVELSPGYPLVQAWIPLTELWGAFEQTLQMAYLNNDYYLGEAGLAIEWDPARTAFDPLAPGPLGWITKLATVDGAGTATVIYDVSVNPVSGWLIDPSAVRIPVVTPYLVAAFAGKMGVHLFASEAAVDPTLDPSDLVLEWDGAGSALDYPNVKDHQALARYIYGACLANGGELPATYDAAVPNRVVCTGVACPP